MKHILFAIGSLYGGGAERVVSVWSSRLAKKGYKVSVLVYSRMENEYPIDNKVEVYTIAKSQKECNDMSILSRLRLFRKKLKEIKPDVVISFLPIMQIYVRIACIGLHIPRIETVRNNPWEIEKGLNAIYSKLWLNCFKTCNAFIVQTGDQKLFFDKKVQDKAVVIPNSINESYLQSHKTEYNDNSHKIIAAGRLTLQKNYKMMIDAVKTASQKYVDITLEIYGVGELYDELNDYINEQGLSDKITLMGRSDSLYKLYPERDLYLMSSDYEGMPNALAEAMAVGLPCISTDCKTGPRDLIENGENGYLVEVGNAGVMAEKIVEFFELSGDGQKIIGENARKKIIDFCSEKNSMSKLIQLIEAI